MIMASVLVANVHNLPFPACPYSPPLTSLRHPEEGIKIPVAAATSRFAILPMVNSSGRSPHGTVPLTSSFPSPTSRQWPLHRYHLPSRTPFLLRISLIMLSSAPTVIPPLPFAASTPVPTAPAPAPTPTPAPASATAAASLPAPGALLLLGCCHCWGFWLEEWACAAPSPRCKLCTALKWKRNNHEHY